jgi:hypothetical protein
MISTKSNIPSCKPCSVFWKQHKTLDTVFHVIWCAFGLFLYLSRTLSLKAMYWSRKHEQSIPEHTSQQRCRGNERLPSLCLDV